MTVPHGYAVFKDTYIDHIVFLSKVYNLQAG